MGSQPRGRPRKPNLQPYYRIGELVELTDTSRRRVERLLRLAGVRPQWMGRQKLVWAADLEAQMPDLWRSLVVCERARAMARALEWRSALSGTPQSQPGGP